MKKNKTIAYMLAATLLVGGTFVGTKALFTDEIDAVGELSISTGDVDIDSQVIQDWTLERNGYEPPTGTSDKGRLAQFENLKKGDKLTKKVEIINKGTLKAVVNLKEVESITGKLPDGIEYKATLKNNANEDINGSVIAPGYNAIIDFTIEVVGGGKHNSENSLNSDEQEKTIIDLNDSYVLEAQQITKETSLK